MPLIVEMRVRGEWRRGGQLEDGKHGSMSHNGPAGRQIYVFGCEGPYSLILRSRVGVDYELGPFRAIKSLEGYEEIARLTPESPTFEIFVKTDRMRRSPQRVRFRHE